MVYHLVGLTIVLIIMQSPKHIHMSYIIQYLCRHTHCNAYMYNVWYYKSLDVCLYGCVYVYLSIYMYMHACIHTHTSIHTSIHSYNQPYITAGGQKFGLLALKGKQQNPIPLESYQVRFSHGIWRIGFLSSV